MTDQSFTNSPTGVRIENDFRVNLIIDKYDPVFSSMRASKIKHLRSENSEDVVTWNVFRSLRQIEPGAWLPSLIKVGLPQRHVLDCAGVVVNLWQTISPPASLLLLGDEGDSEIDVIIESPSWVWFIEAKFQSDISSGTTTRPLRDQILRNIDVGSYYAGVRDFYFSLLVKTEAQSPVGVETINRYANLAMPRSLLAEHRPDGLVNLQAVSLLTWSDLGAVLLEANKTARKTDERIYAERALAWMKNKGLNGSAG